MHTHSPKKVFSLRTKIARPSSRRRCAQNTTTPGNDHNIRKEYVHNDTKTVASARSYLRISSNKTHSSSSRSTFLSRQKEASFLCANKEKKMKLKISTRAAPKNQTRTALSTAPSRVQFNLFSFARKRTDLKERENTHTCVCFERTFS